MPLTIRRKMRVRTHFPAAPDRPRGRPFAAFARRSGVAAAVLAGLGAMLQPQAGVQAIAPQILLTPDTEARWVPFELTEQNQIRFEMIVDGRRAIALLDTGLSDSIVTPAFAHTARLKGSVAGSATAIGGQVAIRWAASKGLSLGGLARTGGRLAIADVAALAGGRDVDILVGSDILSCCALEIDHDARRFRILPSGRMPFRGETVALALTQGSRAYMTEATLNRRRLRPMIVDTGDGTAVTLSKTAFAASGYRPGATSTTIAYGLGGAVEAEVAVLPTIRLGGLDARNVELRIEPRGGFSERVGAAGRIGTGLLSRYHLLLDPRAGRMVLAPGRHADEPPLRSTSGLLMAFRGDRFEVLHVMLHSPAERGGWRAGEWICRVDGVPTGDHGAPIGPAGWAVGTPGRIVDLELCDGTRRRLTLARFY